MKQPSNSEIASLTMLCESMLTFDRLVSDVLMDLFGPGLVLAGVGGPGLEYEPPVRTWSTDTMFCSLLVRLLPLLCVLAVLLFRLVSLALLVSSKFGQ